MPPDQAPKPSPYDFIQQAPYNPPPTRPRKKLFIIAGIVVLALIVVVAVVASLAGSDKTDNTPVANDQQQSPAELVEYTDSQAFKISYPTGFEPAATEEAEESTQAKMAFYKDGDTENLNAFGVDIRETSDDEEVAPPPAVSDDFTETLKLYTRDQSVTNVRSAALKTSGQDGVRTTADFTLDGKVAKITLIIASAGGKTVTSWFTAEASNKIFLAQIDPILASFELY